MPARGALLPQCEGQIEARQNNPRIGKTIPDQNKQQILMALLTVVKIKNGKIGTALP